MSDQLLDRLYYDLDLATKGFDTGIAKARASLQDLTRSPTAKLTVSAETKSATASLEQARRSAGTLAAEASRVGTEFTAADSVIGAAAQRMKGALLSPLAASAVLGTALVGLAVEGVKSAAAIDERFRALGAALPDVTADLAGLRTEVAALSVDSGRTQEELAGLAVALANIGESDPAEIARDLELIALSADALGRTDATPLVSALDVLADAFGLTAAGAREALTQVVAMSKGKVAIEDITRVLEQSAAKLSSFGVGAVDATAAITSLLDAGVTRRNASTGLIAILDQAGTAAARAAQSAATFKEGDAKALQIFAETVTAANIGADGLLPTMAKLFDALGGSKARFRQAGLGVAEFTVAQKAAAAAMSQSEQPAKTAATAQAELQAAADKTRESTSKLSQQLRNEFGEVLTNLGFKILPTVNEALQFMLRLLPGTKQATRDFAGDVALAAKQFAEGARGFATNAVNTKILPTMSANPAVIPEGNKAALLELYNVLREAEKSGGSGAGLAAAIDKVTASLKALTPAREAVKVIGDVDDAFGNTGATAAAAAEAFTTLITAAKAYATSLGNTVDPITAAIAKQRELITELEATRKAMTPSARAKTDGTLAALVNELNAGLDALRAQRGEELIGKVNSALVALSGNAVASLRDQYANLERETLKNADALDRVGTAEAAAAATRARESIPAIRKQGEALVALTKLQEEFDAASKLADSLGQQSGIAGATIRTAALAKLRDEEKQLRAVIDDGTQSTVVRKQAEEQLVAVLAERQKLTGKAPAVVTNTAADAATRLGVGMQTAAQNALAFAQALGKGGSQLAQIISGVGTLGNGIAAAGAAAKAAGGFGKALDSAQGIASLIPAIGSVIAGGIAVAQGLGLGKGTSPEELKAQQVARENTAALLLLTRGIGDLSATMISSNRLQSVQRALGLLDGSRGNTSTAPVDRIGNLPDSAKLDVTQFFATLGLSMADVEEVAKAFRIQLDGTAGSFRRLSEAIANAPFRLLAADFDGLAQRAELLSLIAGKANDPLEQLANKFRTLIPLAPKLAELFNIDDLGSEEGRQKIRDTVAKLLKDGLNLDPNSTEARAFQELLDKLKPEQFVALFGDILKGLDNFAQVADGSADKLRAFNDVARALGLTGLAYVNGLVEAYANTIKEVNGITDGLDVSTTEGLAALKQRVADIVTALADGGISDAEQKIVDALFAIVDAAESAASGIDAAAAAIEARSKALSDASRQSSDANTILGGDARTRFRRTADSIVNSKGITPEIESILSGLNIETAAGIAAGRKKLQDLYADLAKDGIDASEQVIVDLIKTLLGDLEAVATEGAAAIETRRQQLRADGIAGAGRDNAINDREGLDAFRVTIASYGSAFTNLLSTFDLASLSGVKGAKGALSAFFAEIRGLSDAEVFARFGMTKDELLAGIDAADVGLDGLSSSLRSTADAAADATKAQGDYLFDLNQQWLDATGQGLQAQLNVVAKWVDDMIAEAERLGLATDSVIAQIKSIGASRAATASSNATQQNAQRTAAQAETDRQEQLAYQRGLFEGQGTKSGALAKLVQQADGPVLNPTQNFVASDITAATGTQVLRMTDYLAQILQENQTLVALARRMADATGVLGGTLPTLRVPAVTPAMAPASLGGGLAPVTMVFQLNGPLTGLSPQEAMRQLAEAAAPYISAIIARDAGALARNSGSPIIS